MNDSFLQEQGVSGALIESVRKFRESYPVAEGLENRMSTPEIPFFGKEILEMAIAALLQGENLLLTGEKATGKNVLAETLAYVFRKTDVQRFFPCKHRKCRADRNRYIPEPGGHTPERQHLPLCRGRRFWHSR